jgi:hypothetical protein
MAMDNAADHNPNMRNETTDLTTGDLIPSAAKERAEFTRAVIASLDDLEAGRELSFDQSAIRLGVNQSERRS